MLQLVRAIVGVAWDILRLVVSFLRSSEAHLRSILNSWVEQDKDWAEKNAAGLFSASKGLMLRRLIWWITTEEDCFDRIQWSEPCR